MSLKDKIASILFGVKVEEAEEELRAPPAAPERPGQHFAGWAVQSREGNSVTMTVQFQPGEDGTVALPAGYDLEPMTLYAAYEAEG